ncbi:hypothetical protein D1007_40036 [Hordeum vulgare]|nr:hypothetical protein D1007_40036 [Hordeum vulgare]
MSPPVLCGTQTPISEINEVSSSPCADSVSPSPSSGISKSLEMLVTEGFDCGHAPAYPNGPSVASSSMGPDIPSSQEAHQQFDDFINGMVQELFSCTICSEHGHLAPNCTASPICSSCGSVGHAKSNCAFFMHDNCLTWKRKSPTTSHVADFSGTSAHLGEAAQPAEQFLPVLSHSSPPRTPSEPPPLTPPPPATLPDMANFERDPERFVPPGHHIIDGGPDRLPRTFKTLAIPIARRHEQYVIVVVMPAPPADQIAQVRQEVVDLLHNLVFHVRSAQPWIEGVGLLELRDAGESFAAVQMVPQDLGNDSFVRCMRHNEGVGFRGAAGFRQGCLMFLGVHLDFCNTNDLRAAVNTFGEFHHWVSDDPYLVFSIVFASFPDDILVPRSVTFCEYAAWGGARVSWSAPLFILGAGFAEQMPNDEDRMPLNGNPHPLPG